MASKQAIRDTGIVAVIDVGPMPLPRKGGTRVGGIDVRPGKVAIHAGETEDDARRFADIIRASYADYQESGRSWGEPTGKMSGGARDSQHKVSWFDARSYTSKRNDGLASHDCPVNGSRKVRSRYLARELTPGTGGMRETCPACASDRSPVRTHHYSGPCHSCGELHNRPYNGHDYVPSPLPYAVPSLSVLDVPRIIPADLYQPIKWGPAPARVPAPPAPEPTRASKAPRSKPARRTRASKPASPAPVARATAQAPRAELGPCPRCARTDWATVNGRAWHVANNPDCSRWINPSKHAYAA